MKVGTYLWSEWAWQGDQDDGEEPKKTLWTYYDARDFEDQLDVDTIEGEVTEIPPLIDPLDYCQAQEVSHLSFLMSEVPSLHDQSMLPVFQVSEPPRLLVCPKPKISREAQAAMRLQKREEREFKKKEREVKQKALMEKRAEKEGANLVRKIHDTVGKITPLLAERFGLECVEEYIEESDCIETLLEIAGDSATASVHVDDCIQFQGVVVKAGEDGVQLVGELICVDDPGDENVHIVDENGMPRIFQVDMSSETQTVVSSSDVDCDDWETITSETHTIDSSVTCVLSEGTLTADECVAHVSGEESNEGEGKEASRVIGTALVISRDLDPVVVMERID